MKLKYNFKVFQKEKMFKEMCLNMPVNLKIDKKYFW